jgi:hypothetical protein
METENVMALDSVVPRQASSEPGGPRRDSTEDADESLTRKRPRLRSQSADRIRSTSGELNSIWRDAQASKKSVADHGSPTSFLDAR